MGLHYLPLVHKFLDTSTGRKMDLLKIWDQQISANSVDPHQMPQHVASDQGLHCVQLIRKFLDISFDCVGV